MLDDRRHVAQRLDVVDQRRPLVQALVGGERRLQARVAALALQRVQQAGLLAADVRAGAAVQHQRDGVLGAEDAVAQVAAVVGLADRRVEDLGLELVLAADEDERAVGARGHRADDAALDQQVRVLLHQQAVLERARLGLVRVAAEVLVHRALGQEAGLLAHREAGAAASAQPGVLQLVQQLVLLHLGQRLAQRAVAAQPFVHVDRVQAGLVHVLHQAQLVHQARPPHGSR